MRVLLAIFVMALLTSLDHLNGPSSPIYVRPERAGNAAEIGNEAAARDHDPHGTSSVATKGFNRSCTAAGGCAGVSSAVTVWEGFASGYRPTKLVVYWKAASIVAMFGGSSQARAFIEYSTGGQVWTPMDRFIENSTRSLATITPVEAAVPPGTDAASIKVRARLEVDMIACPSSSCERNLPNPSNLSGQIWISDIRLEVQDPLLSASHERAAKGESVTFRVEGAPGARISNWTFTPAAGGAAVLRTERHTEASWSLAPPESGTASVTVELHGQPQLIGRKFHLSKQIDVREPKKR